MAEWQVLTWRLLIQENLNVQSTWPVIRTTLSLSNSGLSSPSLTFLVTKGFNLARVAQCSPQNRQKWHGVPQPVSPKTNKTIPDNSNDKIMINKFDYHDNVLIGKITEPTADSGQHVLNHYMSINNFCCCCFSPSWRHLNLFCLWFLFAQLSNSLFFQLIWQPRLNFPTDSSASGHFVSSMTTNETLRRLPVQGGCKNNQKDMQRINTKLRIFSLPISMQSQIPRLLPFFIWCLFIWITWRSSRLTVLNSFW